MIDMFYLPGRVCSTKAIKEIAQKATKPYTMISLKPDIEWVYLGQERMVQVMEMTGATMVYADRIQRVESQESRVESFAPVIDYQIGALRNDFDFGAVLLWDTEKLKALVAAMDTEYEFAGLYDLRLRASQAISNQQAAEIQPFMCHAHCAVFRSCDSPLKPHAPRARFLHSACFLWNTIVRS